MKRKIFRVILALIIIIFVLIFVLRLYLSSAMQKSVPDYNQDISLENLHDEVNVFRDQYAVPHIYASNEEDLYRTTGYLMAQDRLWQMDLLRRVTQGRLAEIFPEEMLEIDMLFRSLKIDKKSKQIIDSSDIEVVACLEAFADGVNQFINQNQDNLPVEFKILRYKPDQWKAYHSINLIGYMAWSLKSGWSNLFLEEIRNELGEEKRMELLPNITTQKEYIFPEEHYKTLSQNRESYSKIFDAVQNLGIEVFNASNNWAVSGSKTQSGQPLLANDIHLGYNIPGIWYQIHQVVEGKLNVTGFALPGQPMVIAGHNEKIAWGMTNTNVDNLDFYEEKINPENENQYELNGEWKALKITREVFKNKKGKELERMIRYSHRGPIISDFNDEINTTLSMKWVGDYYSNELSAIYKLNRAENWDDFKEAVRGFRAISQNLNYADIEGNIGLYCCAGVPVRDRGISQGFLPGNTDKYDWQGMLPFEELPYQYNPACNYVVSANNRTIDDNYPHHIGTWYALPYRFERIKEVLEENEKLTSEDFKALQVDVKSKLAESLTPKLLEILDAAKDDMNKQEYFCYENLQIWNYNFETNSNMALLFDQLYLQIVTNLVKDEMGEEMFTSFLEKTNLAKYVMENAFSRKFFSWCDDVNTSDIEENLDDIVIKSFKQSVQNISKQQGGDIKKWDFGKKHTLTLEHALGTVDVLNRFLNLNRGPYALSGSWHTVAQYKYNFSEPFKIVHGASERMIYDLSDWDLSFTVMPTGNSGIPASKHYADQTILYVNHDYHQDYFSRENVTKNAMYITRVKMVE